MNVEILKHSFAAAVLAVSPAVAEAEPKLPPVFMRSNDEQDNELSHIIQQQEKSLRDQQLGRLGHVVMHAARNHQMGHRYRGDTR